MELRRKPEDELPEEKVTPCAACGKPSECEIWARPVCYECASVWRDMAPTYEDIHAKYGETADVPKVYADFTARWAEWRRKSLAPAQARRA